jgi:DNA-binding beta-propeller fold protein YncE
MEIDFETGGILRAVHVGGEPYDLAVSDDCNTLYAALHSSNAVARVDLTTMSVNAIVPLNTASSWSQGYLRGRSIGVAPGHPHTVAIAKGDMDASLCGGSDYGVVIFDDLVARSVEYGQGPGYSVKSIVWSTGADVLYGEDWNSTYAFTVDGTGVHSPMALFPYRVGTAVYDLGRDLYFDKGTGRLYNSFGNVYDTLTSHELGPIKLVDTPAIINSCGTPSAARVTDSNSGKIFFVTGTNPVLGVAAYDKDSLSLLGHAVFSGTDTASGFSEPLRVVRPTTGGLAVVTASGQIVLMQGSLLSP